MSHKLTSYGRIGGPNIDTVLMQLCDILFYEFLLFLLVFISLLAVRYCRPYLLQSCLVRFIDAPCLVSLDLSPFLQVSKKKIYASNVEPMFQNWPVGDFDPSCFGVYSCL